MSEQTTVTTVICVALCLGFKPDLEGLNVLGVGLLSDTPEAGCCASRVGVR
jgi:hypothetical protein